MGFQRPGDPSQPSVHLDHARFTHRIKKTLYYGKMSKKNYPSLALTDIMIQVLSKACLRKTIDFVDIDHAADVIESVTVSHNSLILALYYIQRMKQMNPDYVESLGPSKLFVASMLIASKYLHDTGEDNTVDNDDWAKAVSMDLQDINRLEREFLSAMDWNIYVSNEKFQTMLRRIEMRIAHKEATFRGWYTYTDLEVLTKNQLFECFWKQTVDRISMISATCMVGYLSYVVTLIGASLLVPQVLHSLRPLPATGTMPTNGCYLATRSPLENPLCGNGTTNGQCNTALGEEDVEDGNNSVSFQLPESVLSADVMPMHCNYSSTLFQMTDTISFLKSLENRIMYRWSDVAARNVNPQFDNWEPGKLIRI